ncbi:hypothetical protein BDK51DRAFT_50978 [Blyttiomyces helicus]|uniref:Uncharacterized protein n=1 Tax=Blyttiomyces helicus TaxID=388810 RepID=A0A4P9WDE2_9FUNG|nr:hypothetical protein BDK51DRAFT_50978 [Blyttiomyces helicus]|eukprot:RKO90719.1 hypothetical protein BDK51DRAFT_50978 [Blyttiomyces helicus]
MPAHWLLTTQSLLLPIPFPPASLLLREKRLTRRLGAGKPLVAGHPRTSIGAARKATLRPTWNHLPRSDMPALFANAILYSNTPAQPVIGTDCFQQDGLRPASTFFDARPFALETIEPQGILTRTRFRRSSGGASSDKHSRARKGDGEGRGSMLGRSQAESHLPRVEHYWRADGGRPSIWAETTDLVFNISVALGLSLLSARGAALESCLVLRRFTLTQHHSPQINSPQSLACVIGQDSTGRYSHPQLLHDRCHYGWMRAGRGTAEGELVAIFRMLKHPVDREDSPTDHEFLLPLRVQDDLELNAWVDLPFAFLFGGRVTAAGRRFSSGEFAGHPAAEARLAKAHGVAGLDGRDPLECCQGAGGGGEFSEGMHCWEKVG